MGLQNENIKQAFEVEVISSRKNYSFLYIPEINQVQMLNTSRGYEKYEIECIFPDDTLSEFGTKFPFKCETAYDYFCYMYKKSLMRDETYSIYFIGWVDPKTFQPIEEDNKYEK